MTLVDLTGKDPLVPECPKHKGVALIPELRITAGVERSGYWRCPIDNRVFGEEGPFKAKYK